MSARSLRLVALFSVVTAAACSSGTEPTTPTSLDPTALISQMSSSAGQSVAASLSTQGPTPALPTVSGTSCTYSASSQSFVCPSTSVNGMTITMSYFLYDLSGHSLSAPDPLTLDAIRTVVDMSGTTTQMGSTMMGPITMTRHQDQTMSGLHSGNRVINGTASSTMSSTMMMSGSSLSMSSTEADTTVNLIPPAIGSTAHYPLGGTQIMNQSTTTSGLGTFPMRMVMTFHSDGTVTAVYTTAGLTHICTINLASPSTLPVCS